MASSSVLLGLVILASSVVTVISRPSSNAASTQYLPFYGGGKGQYLEIKKDTSGKVLSEAIVSEEKISNENIIKNTDDNLLAKVLAANLQNLKTSSSNAILLLNLGRKKGYLSNAEKTRFKNQLSNLGETASNGIKLIEEVSENIEILFKNNVTQLRHYEETDDEDVGEEGIGIDNPTEEAPITGDTISIANPVGLAVIADHGLAAAKPMGTAIAVSGVAEASPKATAISGLDPYALGINFDINNSQKLPYKYGK